MLNQRLALTILGVCLLSSCSHLPGPLQLMIQPVQQVRHAANDMSSGYYRLGRYHQERGDLELALTAYTYAIARDPAAPEPRIAAAILHARQGRLPQARAMLLAVCAEYPELVQPRNNLGYVYYLQGEYAAAAAAFRQALALEPANERARNNLALADSASAQPVAGNLPRPAPLASPATGTIAGAPPTPAAVPVAAAAPAEQASGMQLVRLAPNRYELRMAERTQPSPLAAVSAPAPAAVPAPRVKLAAQPANAVKPAAAPAALVKPAPPAAAVKPATPLAAEHAAVVKPSASRLEIANGNGVAGMARRYKELLGKRGIAVSRLTNARPFGRAGSSIEFVPGFERQARELQAALGGKPSLQKAAANAGTDLRLVLGKDAVAWTEKPVTAALPTVPLLTSAGLTASINKPYVERK
ncbi:LytR C-terminal domain-containing protein [Massilia cavernae]|uniref:Tetratricopeptide repeat protein n=1 Tax=Massilia cavernae TaxID=2320864 RepID=A0A418XXV7_9BURK|nr:LytR C-terminal domain-containing protein [Massilia cavernae]RJG17804.1 tetratricopeptide repeat protein [Massilia cavernae]